jgi:hypothetical protein
MQPTKAQLQRIEKIKERMLDNPDLILWVEAIIRRFDRALEKQQKRKAQ